MTEPPPPINLIITIENPKLNEEELERASLRLLAELKQNPAIESIRRTEMAQSSESMSGLLSKGVGRFVAGVLTAEVTAQNIGAVFSGLCDRLVKKTIELEVEANGKRLKVTASNPESLKAAVQEAQNFISAPAGHGRTTHD